jgi:hypothetical protein
MYNTHGVKGQVGEENFYSKGGMDSVWIRFLEFSIQSVYGEILNHIWKKNSKRTSS